MQANFSTSIRTYLSNDRLTPYEKILKTKDDKIILSHYIWNIKLSECFYPLLQILEISLRNSINNAIIDYFGFDDWYEDKYGILEKNELVLVSKAKDEITKRTEDLTKGKIIAELNFGFWTSLFNKRYDVKLWHKIIKKVFPDLLRKNRNRKYLSRKLNEIRKLRNRIFHHEPIWNNVGLKEIHDDIVEVIGGIDTHIKKMVILLDNFDHIYDKQFQIKQIESQIGDLFIKEA
ncbi:MAG: Abi family protein [Deferribacterales bacterium]|jgi:hypothetical protein|uniref:Abi family protein n=1 Tax=Deferrivibrio essentukiensis TaxID=2880922 RepID=UPI0019929A1E|nr:Abi family protein [Deferrivibrio essentukiensis]MBC7196332.1 Abi family protein [Deferribacterales bacterium]MCB4204804.1 Abi family protein [Deferrivibrio essentukiensis]